MLKAINTKILLSILAVLTAIAGYAYHEHEETVRARAAAEKAAAILAQQQKDAEAARKADEEFRARVENQRREHSAAAGHEGKTWQTYIP